MKKRPFLVGLAWGILIGCAMVLAPLLGINALLRTTDAHEMSRKYRRIQPEMTRAEVEGIMGSPGERSEKFQLPQRAGYEMEYYVAEHVGASYFLSWAAFPDVAFIVAFDARDRVVYKASGTT